MEEIFMINQLMIKQLIKQYDEITKISTGQGGD